jgi:hypothetical protein
MLDLLLEEEEIFLGRIEEASSILSIIYIIYSFPFPVK